MFDNSFLKKYIIKNKVETSGFNKKIPRARAPMVVQEIERSEQNKEI